MCTTLALPHLYHMLISDKLEENIQNGERLVRAAAAQGAQIILLQELFAGLYFPQARG